MSDIGKRIMYLLDLLLEQTNFNFTGKINILKGKSNQFVGAIYQLEGQVVRFDYKALKGKKALFQLVVDIENEDPGRTQNDGVYKFVPEPEIVEGNDIEFRFAPQDIGEIIEKASLYAKDEGKLRPPGHLRLLINPDFAIQGDIVGQVEYDLLVLLTEYSKVEDLYSHSELLDFEITSSLVSLRKKGAIKVVN